nr:ABC transporter ATP-binding protein [Bacillus sp. Marseille-P3661]
MERQKTMLVASIVLVLLSSLLGLLGPYLIGQIIDDYIIPKDVNGTLKMVAILFGIYAIAALLTWYQSYLMVLVSLRTIRSLREEVFVKLQTLSLKFFDTQSDGDLMSRITNDTETLNQALSRSVIQFFTSILTVVGTSIAMLALNWKLALVSFIVIPLMLWVTRKIVHISRKNFSGRQRDLGELNGYIEESISGGEIITLFGKEQHAISQFNDVNERLRQSALRAELYSGVLGPFNNFISHLGLGLVIAVGAVMALNDYATVGMIAAFVVYSNQFTRPINQMATLLNMIQSAIAGAERVFETMDEVPDLKDAENTANITSFAGEVEFSKVSFSYNQEQPVLRDINFKVKAGQTLAVVGPTGSGKTTIVSLLMRFYDIDSGEIKIDGQNITQYKISELRKRVGVVLQDTYLFSGTIKENIRYGRLDATDEEVVAASKTACAHGFIKHLPRQYETLLTSGGANISQGQKQLIAIARAILADADILILDEATSNLDTRTEREIQKGLANLKRGKTTFVIAHRLKTIESADHIIVISNGELIEEGNHEELLQMRKYYYELYRKQFEL